MSYQHHGEETLADIKRNIGNAVGIDLQDGKGRVYVGSTCNTYGYRPRFDAGGNVSARDRIRIRGLFLMQTWEVCTQPLGSMRKCA